MLKCALLPDCDSLRPEALVTGRQSVATYQRMRVDVGSGYRLYFARRGRILIVMLAGGDKSSQNRDIKRAHRILKELESEL